MTHVQAAEILTEAVNKLMVSGYIVTGDVSLCIPKTRGLVTQGVTLRLRDDASVVELRARPIAGNAVSAVPVEPLPTLSGGAARSTEEGDYPKTGDVGVNSVDKVNSLQLAFDSAIADLGQALVDSSRFNAPASSLGYTGETCVTCGGARMQRAGTCAVCLDCGATGGCS